MDCMAEGGRADAFEGEDDIFRFHASLVAAAAILFGRDTEGPLAVVAGAAGLSLFHLIHGHGFAFAGNDLAVVAALAGATSLGDMNGVAEYGAAQSIDLVSDIARFPLVAADTVLFGGNAEGLDPGMTGAARLVFFHLGHGEVATLFQVEDGVVADFAVLLYFAK